MKNRMRILHIIAVLGVLFLSPAFGLAKSAPAFSIEKMQLNGDYTVQVYTDGKWVDAGKLSFDKHYKEKSVDVGKIISGLQAKNSSQSPAQVIRIRLIQKGGGAAHIDSVFLGGSAPIKISQAKDEEEFLLKKLSKKDYDVIDAFGKTFELEFPANAGDKTLKLTARVEATEISKTPFQFPLSNLFKQMTTMSSFYTYKIQEPVASSQEPGTRNQGPIVSSQDSCIHSLTYSLIKSFTHSPIHPFTRSPFFKEYSRAASGHPSGYTYGWVGNDDENLFVKIDFTGDNTMDGDKDYSKVYVKTDSGLKEFKVSVPETKWGTPSFSYTDKVDYQHKVYDFKIPLSEIMTSSYSSINPFTHSATSELQLAFAAYGTCSPGTAGDYNVQDNRFLVVYAKGYDIYGRQINPDGAAETEFLIATGSSDDQTYPSVAYDSVNKLFLVVWHEYDGSTYNIYGQLVDRNGQLLTRTGTPGSDKFIISSASGNQEYPSVAYDSMNRKFLVVWVDTRNGNEDIYGQLLNNDGSPDDVNFVVSDNATSQTEPAVAFDNMKHRFLTVWGDVRNGDLDVYGQFVDVTSAGSLYLEKKDGTPGAENFPVIANIAKNEFNPSIAYDNVNEKFLVVWKDNRNFATTDYDIFGRLVNANDGSTGADFAISNAANSQSNPSSVFNFVDKRFFVVWHDRRNADEDVYGQFLYADGTLVDRDGNGLADPAADNFYIGNSSTSPHPSAVFNSNYSNFVVAYEADCTGNNAFALIGPKALIPRTGQSICYDASGKVVDCSNTGQDGDIQAGIAWPNPRFVINADGTITDKLTGLVWAKDGGSPAFESVCAAGTKTWQDALTYVNCLKNNNYLGHGDWRLPNVNELASIVNYGETNIFTWLNGQGFTNMQSGYWSSTTCDTGMSSAMSLSGSYGTVICGVKTNLFNVIPVRGEAAGPVKLWKTGQTLCYDSQTPEQQQVNCVGTGQDGDIQAGVAWPVPRFTASGGIVTDNLTSLTWMKDAAVPEVVGPPLCATGTKTWQDALNYIVCLNTNSYLGFNDWRLPNVNELRSVVNYGSKGVLCGAAACTSNSSWLNNTQGFMNVKGIDYYWSSDSTAYRPDAAWFVNMTDGMVSYSSFPAVYKAGSRYVWPVRGGQEEFRPAADVSVGVVGPLSATAGTDVINTINMTNNGPGTAYSLFLTYTLPAAATFISASPLQGKCDYDSVTGKVNCGIGNVLFGAAATAAEVIVRLNNEGANIGSVFAAPADNDPFMSDNSASLSTTVASSTYAVLLTKAGTGMGTAKSSEASPHIYCTASCGSTSFSYSAGASVTLDATAETGSTFAGWTGCDSVSGTQCFLTVDRAENVAASFNLTNYNVTPAADTGGGISPDTTQNVGYGSVTSFTITADSGYSIASVTGCGGSLSGNVYTTGAIAADCTVTASFSINSYVLTVSKAGTGSGTVTGTGAYAPGSSASVAASADANSAFTGWGGDCTDKSNPATLIMDGAKTCIANFVFSYYSLAINKTGDGTITLNPPGMSCTGTSGGDCYKYNKGQKVTLIASAGKGYIFKGWSSCSGTRPCQVTLDADKSVTASFEAVVPKISISSGGIDLVPGADNYLEFDKVRVGRLKTKTLKIKNSGMGNLIMSALVDGDDAKMFSRKMGSKVTIRPGKSYNLRVTFKPRSADEKSAELVINSNDPDMPSFKIDLGGVGFIRKK